MKKGKKMSPRIIIELFLAVLFVHNAQGYSNLPALKNYNENVTKEDHHIKRIVAFGDSLTEGYLDGGRKFYPYSTKLEEKLNAYFNWTRFEVLNEGISGECAFTEMVTRLPKVLDRIGGDRVDLVIILGGTNDFHKLDCVNHVNVAHEVLQLHKIVHKRGIRTVLVTIPECSSLGNKCDETRERVNDKLRSYAMNHTNNTLLCDLGKFMPLHNMSSFDRQVYWDDQVHPSKIGYDKIAALLFHTIKDWLTPPSLGTTAPPTDDDSESKEVPDPDPINKLKGHKISSKKKKASRDKKLAKALVSDANSAAANSSNYGNTVATQFSPANTQTITSLPSVSSSTSISKSAEMALEATDPTYSNNKAAPPLKVSKPHHKHKNKKLLNAVASQTTTAAKNYPLNQSSSVNTTTNSYSTASGPATANASPSAPSVAFPVASPSTPNNTSSATSASTAKVTPTNSQPYISPKYNTSNQYAQYHSNNDTSNSKPNGSAPTQVADTSNDGDLPKQYPDNQSSDNANSSNYTQPPVSNNTSNPNTGYYNNNNNTSNTATNPNVKSPGYDDTNMMDTPGSTPATQGDIGDLQRNFPEFNL